MSNEFGCKINASYVENGDEWSVGINYDDSLGAKFDCTRSSENGDCLEDLALDFTEKLIKERNRIQEEQAEKEQLSKDDIIEELQNKIAALEAEKQTLIEHNKSLHKPQETSPLDFIKEALGDDIFLHLR